MYRALVVCNSHFPADPNELCELLGPKVDGVYLRDALTHHEAGMFDKNDVHIITDGDSAEVCQTIDEFFGSAKSDDTLAFYYSGHGFKLYQQLFLCTRNTVVDRIFSSAIPQSTLMGIVTNSSAQVKILLFDCCHGGMVKGEEFVQAMDATGHYIISASPATGLAKDARVRGKPSPFTEALSEGLISKATDRNGDGDVDLDDLYTYIESVSPHGMHPKRNFDGSGAIPIARRRKTVTSIHGGDAPAQQEAIGTGQPGGAGAAGAGRGAVGSYLDNVAVGCSFNSGKVAEFRRRMHSSVVADMPEQLTAAEFLQRAILVHNGALTYAGLLLFGDNPTAVLPSAMAVCARFRGTSKSDPLESLEIQDTVPETIIQARDFVADLARLGETPTTDGAYAKPVYSYPMIAVREIIANAVVHRDYERHDACVQIHAYSDRIEVISPGDWGMLGGVTGAERPLGDLAQQSQRRNYRLARTLTWSRLVEGVGAGVPRALADCLAVGAPEPMVSFDDRMVTVTIYPRPAEPEPSEQGRVAEPTVWPGEFSEVNAENPLFFLSYARGGDPSGPDGSPSAGSRRRLLEERLFRDLSENVAQLVSLRVGVEPGFLDRSVMSGRSWSEELLTALGTCQVFVPLLSPRYLQSEWCGMEWHAFSSRTVETSGAAVAAPQRGVIPVMWAPVREDKLPPAVRGTSFFSPSERPSPAVLRDYLSDGLYGLMRTSRDTSYQVVVWQLSKLVARLYHTQRVKPRKLTMADLQDDFGKK